MIRLFRRNHAIARDRAHSQLLRRFMATRPDRRGSCPKRELAPQLAQKGDVLRQRGPLFRFRNKKIKMLRTLGPSGIRPSLSNRRE